MLRNLIVALMALTLGISCSNLDNKNDQEQLVCGESLGVYHALVHIDSPGDFDAILVKDGIVKRVIKTEKSCIAIPAEDRDYRLLVRDTSKSRSLHLEPQNIRPGLSSYSLTEDSEGKRFQMRARCPADEIQVSKELLLFFKRSESNQVTYPMVRINVLNPQNVAMLQVTRVLGDEVSSLPLDLPDGHYKLEMENFDAFDAEADAGLPESCRLVIDRNSPEVDLKVERLKGFDDSPETFTIAPASMLEFVVGQEDGAEVSICLKKRQDEGVQSGVCELTEFTNVGSRYNAPGGGAWDLYAYARDKAGNKSVLKHFRLNVYQDAVISEIHALSRTISLMVKDNLEYEAFKNLKRLIEVAKKLELKSELRDIYWQLLAHFHWAATRNSLVWEQQFEAIERFDWDSANHSLYGEEWAIGGTVEFENAGASYVFKQGDVKKIPVRYEEFQFLSDGRMVGIRWDAAKKGMVLEIFKDEVIINRRYLDRFYEDVFIDQSLKKFVLVGASQLLLINMEDLDDQRAITLPAEANPYPHSGMELSPSPDSTYYYITVAANFLRVHVASGFVQVYKDQRCWIEKAVVAPGGDVYYTGSSDDTSYTRKNCLRAYKMNWDGATPSATPVLSTDEDYDSLIIVDIQGKPCLVAFRSNYLDVLDLSTQAQHSLYIDEFVKSGKLSRHPTVADVFYLQSPDTIYKMSLRDSSPWERDQPFNLAYVPIPIKTKYLKYFPTHDPGTIMIVYDSKVQIRSFHPENQGVESAASFGASCKVNEVGSHSICMQNSNKLVWKAHLEGTAKEHQIDFELATWELLTDGSVIILSKNNELYIWKPKEEKPEKYGVLELKGKLAIGWYPAAELVTISHYFDRNFLATQRHSEMNPRTIFLTKQRGEWGVAGRSVEGLPLMHSILPFVLIGRGMGQNLFLDVVNSRGSVVNSMIVDSSGLEDLSQVYSSKFYTFERVSLALKNVPSLYVASDEKVKKIDLNTGDEQTVLSIPDGYTVLGIDPSGCVMLSDEKSSRIMLMNVKSGQLSELDYDRVKEEWPAAISHWGMGIKVEKSGEKLELDVRNFFLTPNEFVVGYTRRERTRTVNSIIRIEPEWMDMQLRKSRLYDLQRKELVSDEDYPTGPTPSPL